MKSIKKFYNKNGFIIVPNLLNLEEVQSFRKKISSEFNEKKDRKGLATREVIEKIPSILDILLKEKLITCLKEIFDHDFSYSNGLNIQKNNTCLTATEGWHEDVQSQKLIKNVNKTLDQPHYKFCKIGIYLQNNSCPFGSSVDIFPRSHKFNNFFKHFIFYLLFKRWIGVPIRSLFTKKLDQVVRAGDVVIFDSHLIHRSSLVRDESLKQKESHERDLLVNSDDYKFSIYFEGGKVTSCKQYQQSNLVRALVDETGVSDDDRKWFSDCLSMSSDFYPQDFLEKLKGLGMDIQFLEEEKHRKIAEEIYIN